MILIANACVIRRSRLSWESGHTSCMHVNLIQQILLPKLMTVLNAVKFNIKNSQKHSVGCRFYQNKISQTMSLTSHKSLASTEVSGSSPRSDQDAVTVALDELLFHNITTSLLSMRGPAQTCTFTSKSFIKRW